MARELFAYAGVAADLVHKHAPGEVMLARVEDEGDLRFRVEPRWARQRYVGVHDDGGPTDPLLLLETARQLVIYAAHSRLGVPRDHVFVLSELSTATSARLTRGDVELTAACVDLVVRPRRVEAWLEVTARLAGEPAGHATLRWSALAPVLYRRVRKARPGAEPAVERLCPVHPTLVGQRRVDDVVLAHAPGNPAWRLRLKPGHPVFFDHHNDHVSGMPLLEAFRQAATARGWQVTALSGRFDRFAEPDRPVWITADDRGAHVELHALQDGLVVASGRADGHRGR